jgi:hypothetical protein
MWIAVLSVNLTVMLRQSDSLVTVTFATVFPTTSEYSWMRCGILIFSGKTLVSSHCVANLTRHQIDPSSSGMTKAVVNLGASVMHQMSDPLRKR